MPMLDDLREAMVAREMYAGDPDKVQQYVLDHGHSAPSRARRRYLAPSLAVVAVAGTAVATAVLTSGPAKVTQHSAPPLRPGPVRATHVAPARPGVPANALRWQFSFAATPGYSFSYQDYQPDQQNAEVTSTADKTFYAGITVYERGAFDPKHGSVDGTAVRGKHVSVDGHSGVFVSGPSTPTLFWTYDRDSWATVGVGDDAAPLSPTAAEAAALRIARSVRVGTAVPLTLPFRVGFVPKSLRLLDVDPNNQRASIMYGTSFSSPSGQDVIVSRWAPATNPLQRKALRAAAINATITRHLADGSWLLVGFQRTVSAAQRKAIVNAIDVSPSLADPSTWLAVTP